MKAIKFEQKFADEFLPNAESALVLGQACRSAFSIPILEGRFRVFLFCRIAFFLTKILQLVSTPFAKKFEVL